MFRITQSIRVLLAATAAALPTAAQSPAPTSLTIGGAARLAADRSASATVARERAVQQATRAAQIRSDLLPSLNTSALLDGGTNNPTRPGAGYNGTTPVPNSQRTVDMELRLTQRLFDLAAMGRYKTAAAEAQAMAQSARASIEDAAEAGALSYVRALRSGALLDARVADSALAAELLEIARQQLAAGTGIALDVTRAESQLASAISDLITVRNQRAREELELLRTLNLPITTAIELADSLREPAQSDFATNEAEAVKGALTRRGDVLAAAAFSTAARRQISAARAEFFPSVSLFGAAGSNTDGVLRNHSYGIQVSVPVFDGFYRKARIVEAQARTREADAEWQDARLRTEVEVRTALLDLTAARERVAAAKVQLGLAEQEVAQARERFRAGVADNADVISASLTLNGARDILVEALTAYHVARVGLASAQGATTAIR